MDAEALVRHDLWRSGSLPVFGKACKAPVVCLKQPENEQVVNSGIKSMHILIYGINYHPELTGIGKYTGEMAEWLASRGHEVRVVTTPPYYPAWKVAEGFSAWRYRKEIINKVTVSRVPLFVPSQPKTLARILHLMSFPVLSIPNLMQAYFWKPTIVVSVKPTFFCAPLALLLAKLSGARSWLHIQDFEIDAMFCLGMMGAYSPLMKLVFKIEKSVIGRFDRVSTISHSMLKRLIHKNVQVEKQVFFPNWVDVDFVTPRADRMFYRKKWGIGKADRVVLYAGNMGKKQGLEIVLKAAQAFLGRPHVHFILVGEGVQKAYLMQQAEQMRLHNVRFYPLQPYRHLPELLASANVHLVVQKKGAADLVLPSKLTAILAAGGHALITAEAHTELGLLVEKYPGIAKRVEPEETEAFIEGLEELLERMNGFPSYNRIARTYVANHLGKEFVLERFEKELLKLCA